MAKSKSSKRKVNKKSKTVKKEPIGSNSIWHIVIGILALAGIVAIIILAIPEDGVVIDVPSEIEEIEEEKEEVSTETTSETEQPGSSEVPTEEKKTETITGGNGGSESSESSSSEPDSESTDDLDEIEECSYIDTDGGNDHFVQGTCDDGKAVVYTDYCQDEEILVEYWLGEGEACYDGCQGDSTLFYCPSLGNGWSCSEGACVLEEGSCDFIDSDGGWNLEIQGTCDDGKAVVYTDSCSNNRAITEYRLHPSEPCTEGCTSSNYVCPILCEDGSCVTETTKTANQQCSDYCQAQRATSYKTGVCVDYNEQGAISKENACANSGFLNYESTSEGKCHADSICCCADELEIQ